MQGISLVERYVRDVEAGGSNPLTPTIVVESIDPPFTQVDGGFIFFDAE